MRKKFSYIYYFIIIIVGILDIFYGIYFEYMQYQFKKDSIKTDAYIYAIVNRNDKRRVLYINFTVENKEYDGILLSDDLDIEISDKIKIYYDQNNPKKFTDGKVSKNGYFIILLGIIFSSIGFSLFISSYINYK